MYFQKCQQIFNYLPLEGYKNLIPWFTDPPASDFLLHNAYFWLQMNKMNYLKCPCKFRKKKNNPDLGD